MFKVASQDCAKLVPDEVAPTLKSYMAINVAKAVIGAATGIHAVRTEYGWAKPQVLTYPVDLGMVGLLAATCGGAEKVARAVGGNGE